MALPTRLRRLARARLYAILDTGYVPAGREMAVAEQMIAGGVDLIQLRAKQWTEDAIAHLGLALRAAISPEGPLFILNDHPILARQMGADGVHVGQDDLTITEAREFAGDELLIGKSTHSLTQAIAAEEEGADYIGVGPLFATPTKPDYTPVGPELVAPVARAVHLPQFCIGGIKEANLPQVLAAGARRVVIVSELLQAGDIAAYCRRVKAVVEAAG